jgi:predicted RNase H-like HicB family nuclease
MQKYLLTAVIEKDPETGLYFGFVPGIAGAHSQGETLEELRDNLQEVTELCVEEEQKAEGKMIFPEFVGTQQLAIEA